MKPKRWKDLSRVSVWLWVFLLMISSTVNAESVRYEFTGNGFPIVPVDFSLAGTEDDWSLIENPDNIDVTQQAIEFTGSSIFFTDNENLSGNLGIQTPQNAALREEYQLSGPGDRLYIICDHQWHEYGERANREPDNVDNTRIQMFWFSFLTSTGDGIGLHYGAGNYNTEGETYFQAIGNGDLNQDEMLNDYAIEQGSEPNLDRRTITLRVTESAFEGVVIVDAKYGDGDYQRISSFYDLGISNFPAGNQEGDENVLASIGNYSGSGAIIFEMFNLTITDEDPDPDASGANEPIALRSSSNPTITIGESVEITIQVFNPMSTSQQITITENIPEEVSVSNISHGGTSTDTDITWDISLPSGMTELTYSISVPEDISVAPILSGTVGEFDIGGVETLGVLRGFAPFQTDWQPPQDGWDYIFDPDLGSTPDLELEGWKHDNSSDAYVYQPTIPAGPNEGVVWENPGLIDDEMGGQTLLIYDPGDPRNMDEYGNIPDPSNRKITISYDLGVTNTAVAAFRVRSTPELVDQFGVEIPFGYEDEDEYPLLGLAINEDMQDLSNWEALSASGLFFSNTIPDSLNFPSFSGNVDAGIEAQYEDNWDNTIWHEYWITWNFNEGEKATALYVDGELDPKFSFPIDPEDPAEQAGAFFNRYRDTENDIPTGNTVFRITFRQTPVAGNLQFDYIALKAGTDEPPTEFVGVTDWSLY